MPSTLLPHYASPGCRSDRRPRDGTSSHRRGNVSGTHSRAAILGRHATAEEVDVLQESAASSL